jgi:DNA-binding response OmpR family regulator
MKLDYKIIWIDDKIETRPFQYLKEQLKDYLQVQFFDVSIEEAEDFIGFKEKFKPNEEYDLIITDLTLNDSNGKQIIDYVREVKHNFTEIFFYSANSTLKQTNLLNNNRITFFQLSEPSAYRELGDEIENLISLTISKFQHVVSMRGMIMHETSTIDAEMLDIVTNYIAKTNDSEVKNRIYNEIISFHSRKLEDSEKFKKNDKIENILKDPLLISSTQRANALDEIIKTTGGENFIDDLKLNIIKVRNDFAHAVYVKDQTTGREYFLDKKDGIDFNEEKCKEIRLNIIRHKKNIEDLRKKL